MGRILALDLGTKRVGVALTDPLQMIASPLGSFTYRSESELAERIERLARKHEVEAVVIGLPLKEDGTEGEGCFRSRRIGERLSARCIPFLFWDERYSSRMAEEVLRECGKARKSAREKVDGIAASLILQEYLSSDKDQIIRGSEGTAGSD